MSDIKNIEWMKFVFPAESEGVGVDKRTGLPSDAPESKLVDEESVELLIKFYGDPAMKHFSNQQAMRVYEEVWKLLNDQK